MGKDQAGITNIAILAYNQIDFNINTFIQIKGVINNNNNSSDRSSYIPEFGGFPLFWFQKKRKCLYIAPFLSSNFLFLILLVVWLESMNRIYE